MEYKYYSQFGEDYLMWEYFKRKKTGFYVEVGAFDGIHFSNTYSFECMGWKGICLEPHPDYYPLCSTNRPNSICYNIALVSDDSTDNVVFYAENLGLLSGINPDIEDLQKRYKNRGLEFNDPKKITVKASTLNQILDENHVTNIDFISIDVEGNEIDVLKGFSVDKYRPEIIIVEANDELHEKEIITYFQKISGYFYSRKTGVNLYFVRGEKNAKRLASLTLNWKPEKQLHPLGEKYSIQSNKNAASSIDNKPGVFRRLIKKIFK